MRQSKQRPLLIVINSRKGGVGKSTVASHISVCAGEKCVLIDADPQANEGSCAAWHAQREPGCAPRFIEFSDYRRVGIDKLMSAAFDAGARYVVIDTAPKADSETHDLLARADLNIIVTEASFFALSALPRSVAMAQAAGKPFLVVINKIKANRLESAQALEQIEQAGLDVAVLGDLADYARALASGFAVSEFSPKGKAAQQIDALWQKVLSRIEDTAQAD